MNGDLSLQQFHALDKDARVLRVGESAPALLSGYFLHYAELSEVFKRRSEGRGGQIKGFPY